MDRTGGIALSVAAFVMVLGLVFSPFAQPQVKKPNIVLILSDDFGYGDAGVMAGAHTEP